MGGVRGREMGGVRGGDRRRKGRVGDGRREGGWEE